MIYIINIIVSLAATWFTYFVYNAKIMKYDLIADQILDFTKRFLFQGAFLVILPLLYTNSIEHQQNLLNPQYQTIIYEIDSLTQSQKESLKAYLNNESAYDLLFLIPIVFILNELYEIYQSSEEIQKTNHTLQSALPPPPILQPKVISEYVQEEVAQLESYYQKQQQQQSIIDESKASRNINFLDKIQFSADSKQQEIVQSEYGKSAVDKQLAVARHLGKTSDQYMKPARTQTIRDTQFTYTQNTKSFDHLQNQIHISLGEISFLQLLFGYVIGVQEKCTISIPLIIFCSFLSINQFRDWILFSNRVLILVPRPVMVTYLFLLYLLQIMSMVVGMYFNCLLMQISYCIICGYFIKPYFKLFATQTIKTTLISSGISLIVIISIKVIYYLCS